MSEDYELKSIYIVMSEYMGCLARVIDQLLIKRDFSSGSWRERNEKFRQSLESIARTAPYQPGAHFSPDQKLGFFSSTRIF